MRLAILCKDPLLREAIQVLLEGSEFESRSDVENFYRCLSHPQLEEYLQQLFLDGDAALKGKERLREYFFGRRSALLKIYTFIALLLQRKAQQSCNAAINASGSNRLLQIKSAYWFKHVILI